MGYYVFFIGMRILHVITTLDVGGAERLMVDLLPRVSNAENMVELVVFKGKGTSFYQELVDKGINVTFLSESRGVYNIRHIFKLIHYVGKYDIVHTHNTACQFYAVLAKLFSRKRVKMVTTEHNSTNRRRSIKWLKPIDRWMYNRYDAIVCIADQTYSNLVEYVGKTSHIHTIYNGVDISRFLRPIGDVSGHKDYMITMVAAFRPQKDYDTLLRAMAHLPETYRLQIVGGGNQNEIERISLKCASMGLNPRVSFMGVRADVPDILEKSDIIVLSSHWEGLSLSSIEGMASGRPFIASDVDGLREIVQGAGVLFPEGDDKELAHQIQHLCEHPDDYRMVALKCQERAKQYDISVMAEKYMELYQSLIGCEK